MYAIVRELAVADFRLKYHDSVLGYFWSMLNPLALFAVYYFVFSYLFTVEVPKFTLYLLSGVIFWNFFADATLSSMNSLDGKASLTKKIAFPRSLIIISSTATAVFSFIINLTVLVGVVMIFDHVSFLQTGVFVPALLLIILALGASFVLSTCFLYFRDTSQIWSVCLSIGFWMTPVVYNVYQAPPELRDVVLLNPAARIFVLARAYLVYDNVPPMLFQLTTILFPILLLIFGFWLFRRNEYRIPEYL